MLVVACRCGSGPGSAKRPGSRLAARSGNGSKPSVESPYGEATGRFVASSEACGVVRGLTSGWGRGSAELCDVLFGPVVDATAADKFAGCRVQDREHNARGCPRFSKG